MADTLAADDLWAAGKLSEDQADMVLEAVDAAFTQVTFARYGGAIVCVIAKDGDYRPEQLLRQSPGGQGQTLSLEIHAPGGGDAPPGLGRSRGMFLTPIGTITLDAAAVRDVHVLTEVFDCHDPNEHAEADALHEGVLLAQPDGFSAGATPGSGLVVVRSSKSHAEMAAADERRGWLPRAQRTNTSRSLGIGSNGHQRANVSALRLPVATPLLSTLGRAISGQRLGGAIARIALAVDASAATL